MEKINEIMDLLINKGLIIDDHLELKRLKSGTTEGILYTILRKNMPIFVIKIDHPMIISATEEFLLTYKKVELLPDVLYTDHNKEFIVYSYIPGETHYNRGSKLEWMNILTQELFHHYVKVDKDIPWGRVNGVQRSSWSDFNQSSFESSKMNIGKLIASEDHKRVELLVNTLETYHHQDGKYYLHGDTGVHNFVYACNQLKGVIDPSPLIGPKIYDFTYAFCSSPDNLDVHTLFLSFSLWNGNASFSKEQLLNEVVFQLYTRIGVCIKVHPHDLNGYMEAWEKWRKYLPSNKK
ncbi:hypothetical protein ABE61_17590 [Lysinibacillus sphaericus]|uniref:hypothetical protein n=1 Tax=Lysinibacillus sphaericus TaxID=1421 RepID=UPI0018CF4E1D|nr:hypothetical protein [Lysinibacillus sphaericus]MBG9455811.1 hypothetical protein [Lysinibacillus sphaericus]MBG9477830.1 hypothetical protein [Lysinibacillus sphaericus]MBG9593289.1 hypothetical protein [Lysinibacillus sphaericus]